MERLNNLEINQEEGYILISINPKIYPLDVVYAASYVLMDKAYVLIDGDPEEEVLIEFTPKDKKEDLERLSKEFNNELLSYATYKSQSEKNKGLRQLILQRVLLTNVGVRMDDKCEKEHLSDPKGIMKPHRENEKS